MGDTVGRGDFSQECQALASGWGMAQVALDRPFPDLLPSSKKANSIPINTTLGLCNEIWHLSSDTQVLHLVCMALCTRLLA